MARFPLMIGVAVFCLAPFRVQAQTPHPVAPGMRVTPARTAPPTQPAGTVVATGPPPSATPAPAPAVAPTVVFRDGLLTVQTTNSSLSSVVMAIRNKTGIEFEGVEGGSSEHVALSLGPAPEGEVLSAIFSGSKYDFVAIDRPDAPGIVQKVIVSVKNKPGAPDAPQQPKPAGQEADDDDTPDEQVNAEPQDTPAQAPPVQQPQQAPQAQQQPKSPEQLLQELQQMQQQKAPPDPNNPSQAPRKVPQ